MRLNKKETICLNLIFDLVRSSMPLEPEGWTNNTIKPVIKDYAKDYLHKSVNKKDFIKKAEEIFLYRKGS